MSEENKTPAIFQVSIEPILEKIQSSLPRMIKGRDKAMEMMAKYTEIDSDEVRQEVNNLLVNVRNTYDAIYKLRTEITGPVDELKSYIMGPEKDLDQNSKTNDVFRLRNLIAQYDQKKIDAKKKLEEEAAKQKATENHKVDIVAIIKKNLADMVINRARDVQSGSKEFFDKCTLENFDERVKQFKSFKPVLKRAEHYDKCFVVSYSRILLTDDQYAQLIVDIRAEESYEKYDEQVKAVIIPILNDWVGRVSDIKQKLVDLKNTTDEYARQKLLDEQKKQADDEEAKRQQDIQAMQTESDQQIQQAVAVDKMQNEFREQAVTQQAEDTGPVKLLLKFKDQKPVKALTEIMYHCFMHPKFPDVIKKEKGSASKFDEHGYPVFVDWVDTLVSFYLKNCDVNISGIELKEVSKVIVRK